MDLMEGCMRVYELPFAVFIINPARHGLGEGVFDVLCMRMDRY